ncbi:hypothetical protein ACFFP0_30605 [Rhizobium puerariae]|uniref:Uncharacterized protein n=1 Tax=Rhizobium puerariae TaxID=1585791 RepID=A0ABV6ARH7_9HYPH
MENTAIIILGHSHVGALHDALRDVAPYDSQQNGAHFFIHDVWANRTDYAMPDGNGGIKFNADVLAAIDRVVPEGMSRRYISVMGGNGHIVLSLEKHSRPFDFVLKEDTSLPNDSDAEILPMAYVKKILTPFIMPYVWQMISFRMAVGTTITQLETCPPYADDDYVRSHLGAYITNTQNIISGPLRKKMWRLHSAMVNEIASASGIEFLNVPTDGLDKQGYMHRNGYGPDATHANAWYGNLVVQQLAQSLPIASYTRFSE